MKEFVYGLVVSLFILGVSIFFFQTYAIALFFGWLLPALAGSVTMYFIFLAQKKGAATVTKAIAKGFALKMVYYGVSILMLFKQYSFQPIPFVCSFSGFFMGLHVLEAIIIKRISETYITTKSKELIE